MMEIYNEKIQDLILNSKEDGGLKIRENKTVGIYVENLSSWPVMSFKDIEKKIEEGNRLRTIAATCMNNTSSRAHTIITINIRIIDQRQAIGVGKHSTIHLVDLAGNHII